MDGLWCRRLHLALVPTLEAGRFSRGCPNRGVRIRGRRVVEELAGVESERVGDEVHVANSDVSFAAFDGPYVRAV